MEELSFLKSCVEEIELYVANHILTNDQYIVFRERLLTGASYESLMNHFGLVRNSLIHCILRTVSGKKWYKGMTGVGESYLSDIDSLKFRTLAFQAANDLNCITTPCAVSIAAALKKERLRKAKFLLRKLHMDGLISHLGDECQPPSKTWLKEYAKKLELMVVNSQTLDSIRRTSCDVNGIYSFFEQHGLLLDRHPSLILNMDETMLSGRRKYKVVALEHNLPLTPSVSAFPHLTGVVTVSAAGFCFDPLIIIPNKKTRRGIETWEYPVVSSVSGWMNKRTFMLYAIHIISQLQLYRLKHLDSIRDEPFLLIVDGHCSRSSFYACYLLALFNIELLVLPPHSSHVM